MFSFDIIRVRYSCRTPKSGKS